jgi:hypothetical protein
MGTRNAWLNDTGRDARFAPGWWLLPGMVGSAVAWACVI